MNNLPFAKSGSWYKGNIHTHSTNSDGAKTPREVCAYYKRKKYNFISLTDHFLANYDYPITYSTIFRTNTFTTLLGAELHAPKTSLGYDWHILAVGLPKDFSPLKPRETGVKLAARASAAGAYVAVAHPRWYDLTDNDVISLKTANAIEISNSTANINNGKSDSGGYLDRLLSQGRYYHSVATDDAHFHDKMPDFGLNWLMVKCQSLDPDAILNALHEGSFYSSQGPEIFHVKAVKGKKLKVETSPVRVIRITGEGSSNSSVISKQDITYGELDLSRLKGGFARITVTDSHGRHAWCNPIQL